MFLFRVHLCHRAPTPTSCDLWAATSYRSIVSTNAHGTTLVSSDKSGLHVRRSNVNVTTRPCDFTPMLAATNRSDVIELTGFPPPEAQAFMSKLSVSAPLCGRNSSLSNSVFLAVTPGAFRCALAAFSAVSATSSLSSSKQI